MSEFYKAPNQTIWNKLSSLRASAEVSKRKALKRRLAVKPHATKLEYLLGAFMEMYEPHLVECVQQLAKKGYALDVSSGFGGKNSELQVIQGTFSLNYIIHNKIEKLGVKFREFRGMKSIIFWPSVATLDHITARWMDIIAAFPDNGFISMPSSNPDATAFRRKYIPEDLDSQKQQRFERLKYKIRKSVESDTGRRMQEKPYPDKTELMLGMFIEELEPQVRQAVISMNKKGYSTDASGFMDDPCSQMIEGDFTLGEDTIRALKDIGVTAETNHSGYTRLQFMNTDPDLPKIKRKWSQVISILPKTDNQTPVSMTKKARNFRSNYQK